MFGSFSRCVSRRILTGFVKRHLGLKRHVRGPKKVCEGSTRMLEGLKRCLGLEKGAWALEGLTRQNWALKRRCRALKKAFGLEKVLWGLKRAFKELVVSQTYAYLFCAPM